MLQDIGRVSTARFSMSTVSDLCPIRSFPQLLRLPREVCQVKSGRDQHRPAPGSIAPTTFTYLEGLPAVCTAHYHAGGLYARTNASPSPFDERWPALLQHANWDF